jgi:hypothetical protein
VKYKIIIASVFYLTGLLKIIDWFIFWNRHEQLAVINHQQFITAYRERFPVFIRSFFTVNPEPAAVISIFLFAAAGFIFWKSGNTILKVISITAFIFSCWNLFSIM